jgi:hypothetical protein
MEETMVRRVEGSNPGISQIPEPEIQRQRPGAASQTDSQTEARSVGGTSRTGQDQRQEVQQEERRTRQTLDQQLDGSRGTNQPQFRQLPVSQKEQEARRMMDQGRYGEAAQRYRELASRPRTLRTERLQVQQRQA